MMTLMTMKASSTILMMVAMVSVAVAAASAPPPPPANTAPPPPSSPPPPPPPPPPSAAPQRPPVSGISIDPPVQTVARYSDGRTMHPLVKLADGRIVSHGDVPTTINSGNAIDPPPRAAVNGACTPPACVEPPMQYDTMVPNVTPTAIITAKHDAKYATKKSPKTAPQKKMKTKLKLKVNKKTAKKKKHNKKGLKVPTLEQKMRFTELLSELVDGDDDAFLQYSATTKGDDDDDAFLQTDESEQLGDALMQVQDAKRRIDALLVDASQEVPSLAGARIPDMPALSSQDEALLETMAQTGTITMDGLMDAERHRSSRRPKVVEARLAGGGGAVQAEDADHPPKQVQRQVQQQQQQHEVGVGGTRIVSELPSTHQNGRQQQQQQQQPEYKYDENHVEMTTDRYQQRQQQSSLVKQASEGIDDQLMGTESLLESIAHRYDAPIV